MNADGELSVRLTVAGRVQGVGFRAWVVREARRRKLRGWVRNRHDGSVEMLISGTAGDVEGIIDAAGRGPSLARVDGIHREPAEDEGLPRFETRPTV